jgi:hypothetical protein
MYLPPEPAPASFNHLTVKPSLTVPTAYPSLLLTLLQRTIGVQSDMAVPQILRRLAGHETTEPSEDASTEANGSPSTIVRSNAANIMHAMNEGGIGTKESLIDEDWSHLTGWRKRWHQVLEAKEYVIEKSVFFAWTGVLLVCILAIVLVEIYQKNPRRNMLNGFFGAGFLFARISAQLSLFFLLVVDADPP